MNKQHQFDNAADSWATLREYPWNRLRYEITHDFIRQSAPQRIQSVLNIGCGDGFESYLFSSPDVELTLTDCSEKMLEKAQELAVQSHVPNPLRFIHSDVHTLGVHLDKKYDLILFHNVIEYVDNHESVLAAIFDWLAPDGLLSLRHLNRYSNVFVPAMYENNLELAKEYLDSPLFNSSFGMKMNTFTGEQIGEMVTQAGFAGIRRFGVISLCNFIPDNEIKKEETFYRHLKELEMEIAQKFPYFNIARFGLFLCRKLTWESGC